MGTFTREMFQEWRRNRDRKEWEARVARMRTVHVDRQWTCMFEFCSSLPQETRIELAQEHGKLICRVKDGMTVDEPIEVQGRGPGFHDILLFRGMPDPAGYIPSAEKDRDASLVLDVSGGFRRGLALWTVSEKPVVR